MGDFNAQNLALVAWAFASAGESSATLFATLTRTAVECHIGNFKAQNLANTA